MRYALVFRDAGEIEVAWEAMSGDEQDEAFHQIDRWVARHADRIRHSRHLASVVTATTLRRSAGGKVRLVDGPSGSESAAVSGYIEVEVKHLEEAIDMVRNWPFDTLVEIRAISRGDQSAVHQGFPHTYRDDHARGHGDSSDHPDRRPDAVQVRQHPREQGAHREAPVTP